MVNTTVTKKRNQTGTKNGLLDNSFWMRTADETSVVKNVLKILKELAIWKSI